MEDKTSNTTLMENFSFTSKTINNNQVTYTTNDSQIRNVTVVFNGTEKHLDKFLKDVLFEYVNKRG